RTYTINAPAEGSVVNFGTTSGENGSISIQGWVRAHSAINFRSNGAAIAPQNLDFGPTGVLETLSGGITFDLGTDGVLRGSLIARGPGANVIVHASRTLEIYGSITAQNSIYLSGGSDVAHGTTSLITHSS